ncbi:hypothetical protein GCM10022221_19290 [Actinocorallia aurea]
MEALQVGHVHEADVPWVYAGDVGIQLLRATPTGFAVRNRFKAGYRLPTHKHTGPVNGFTFSGRWCYAEQGVDYVAGTFIHEPPGSVHTLTVLEDTDVLFMVEGAYVEYAEDGTVAGVVDSETLIGAYYALCDAFGIPRPEAVLR